VTALAGVIELRGGSPADLSVIGGIMADAFEPRYGEAWTTNQCMGILALPGVWLTIAYLDGEPAGFTLARRTLDEAELLLLATRRALRRKGIGASLMRATIRDARDRGAHKLHLEVRAGNPATNLYLREGFAKIGVRRDYYRGATGDVFDAHTFVRLLDRSI
jgi:[ribosomal protein S18]-alanine N-acetyltransferase